MYHPQNQRIAERSTYSDSGAQDKQNEYPHHEISLILTRVHYWTLSAVFHKINTPTKLADLIPERIKYSESAAQDEQNDTQHRWFSSALTS